jgi:hypothetical protein
VQNTIPTSERDSLTTEMIPDGQDYHKRLDFFGGAKRSQEVEQTTEVEDEDKDEEEGEGQDEEMGESEKVEKRIDQGEETTMMMSAPTNPNPLEVNMKEKSTKYKHLGGIHTSNNHEDTVSKAVDYSMDFSLKRGPMRAKRARVAFALPGAAAPSETEATPKLGPGMVEDTSVVEDEEEKEEEGEEGDEGEEEGDEGDEEDDMSILKDFMRTQKAPVLTNNMAIMMEKITGKRFEPSVSLPERSTL